MPQARVPHGPLPRTLTGHNAKVKEAATAFMWNPNLDTALDLHLWENLASAFKQLRACQFHTRRMGRELDANAYADAFADECGAQEIYDDAAQALYDWRG